MWIYDEASVIIAFMLAFLLIPAVFGQDFDSVVLYSTECHTPLDMTPRVIN